MDCQGPAAKMAEPPRCSVYSAVSGEVIAVVNEYEGKTAKEIKQIVAAQVGVPRFRQRFFPVDGCCEVADEDVFALDRVQLVQLEVLPPDAREDQKMIAAAMNNDSNVLEKLLQEPRSPNVAGEGEESLTPLHFAAANGHVEPMWLLLEAGAEKDAQKGVQDWTPLLCSAVNGHLESVGLLLQAGADTDLATLDFGWAPLHIAAGRGDVGIVQALVEHRAALNQGTTGNGSTPLHFAAFGGHVRIVRALIEAGADLNQRTVNNESAPRHLAALADVLALMEARADRNQLNQAAVLWALIDAGTDLNGATIRIGTGTTALFVAAQKGHVQIVQLLIEAGADLNQGKTIDGRNDFCFVGACSEIRGCLLQLHQASADIDISRMSRHFNHEATPLHAAVMNGHVQIARLLIDARAHIEGGDCGITPLWIAALKGHVDIVRFLIEAGANIESIRSGLPIPMLIAAQYGHVEVVRLLQQKAQQMRRASPYALPSAGPLWYSLRPVPPIRIATVMQPVPITAVMTFVPGAPPPNAVGSNPCGSTSSSTAREPRRKQKSCC